MDIVGATGITQKVARLQPKMVTIGPLSVEHAFLCMSDCPMNLLGRDLLCKLRATIQCTESGDISLHIPEESLKAFPLLFLDSNSTEDSLSTIYPLLEDLPKDLWSKSSTDVGLLKSATLVQT